MTGLERLRELVDGMAEWSVFTVMERDWCERHGVTFIEGRMAMKDLLSEIADQIERETAHDPSKDVSMSAYDLLPECDRKAISLALDCGGVEEIKKRLMPAGMEWPRFEDGEPVRIGDEVADETGIAKTQKVNSVKMMSNSYVLCNPFGGGIDQRRYGERVKRPAPKVLDADGVEIREGDTVYAINYGSAKCTVLAFENMDDGWLVEVENEIGHKFRQTPDDFTHRAPALAADGKPLREGETVYDTEDRHGYPHTVVSTELDGLKHVKTTCEEPKPASVSIHPSRLTHERPDSWKRLEEDAARLPFEYCALILNWTMVTEMDDSRLIEGMAHDLVRRAKKLAGVS